MPIAQSIEPPYVAVIFSSQRSDVEPAEYAAMSEALERLARDQPGFLGLESARDSSGFGITVSYWRDDASIRAWRQNALHLDAQRKGRERWYTDYVVRVAKVERRG